MYGIRSYTEREWLDRALLVGMTPDEFWYGDPELYYNYVRAFREKEKLEQKHIWVIGARMCQALQSSVIFPAGVIDSKTIKNMPKYPECPYEEIDNESELTEKEKEYLRMRAYVNFSNWVNSFKREN